MHRLDVADPGGGAPDPHDQHPHDHRPPRPGRALRVGIGGPVGCGKTALVAALCRALGHELSLAVVTNDIYTTEDADFLRRQAVLADDRIVAVRTGCCPHTAIRDDITANLDAVEDLVERHDPELVLVESGGDNLTATFSYGLVDRQIFVLDTAGGDDVPRKGGPGVAGADLLVVNKTDLAPHVGVDLARMVADAGDARAGRPVVALSRTDAASIGELTGWVMTQLALHRAGTLVRSDPGPMAPHGHAHDHAHGHAHAHDHAVA